MTYIITQKNASDKSVYICDECCFTTDNKYDYNRHLKTEKHQNTYKYLQKNAKNANEPIFTCNCGKLYKHRQSLYNHKKVCNGDIPFLLSNDQNEQNDIKILTNLVLDVVKQNQELTNKIADVCSKNNSNTNILNNNINSNNKTFNLQVFLNETCKDAMNIMDFVNSLKIELSDLENVGNVGYVSGISSIIVKNLNLLDETKRPVHCADTKREVMYVKDDNKWEKDNENKSQMRKIIKHATHKNSKLLKEYKAKYPGCEKSESKYSYAYDKLIVETFGGKGDDEIGKENKIIRNIAKNVTINKDNS